MLRGLKERNQLSYNTDTVKSLKRSILRAGLDLPYTKAL